ncbi:MAG: sigma 54-interacting transcriptional regulator [Polyangiaceae bacterium]|nr:sigma 54-interacting transcriptional regulator [Polyangiaceae bacterium]
MTRDSVEFPARYEPLTPLGKGGGGEVWAARDRLTGDEVALKLLRPGADEAEMLALVREATVLSAVEGLAVPRVLHFGRLPRSGRVYMVRDIVPGRSLADVLQDAPEPLGYLAAVADAAFQLTHLHRALLLHGDIKPANIIVDDAGRVTLVDLGLAAHWREGGAKLEGLTPRYAAPELFRGAPLTVRAEVFALGATAAEALALPGLDPEVRAAVEEVVGRAVTHEADARYPSADEFAEALRRALGLPTQSGLAAARAWTLAGLDAVAGELILRLGALAPGAGLVVAGPPGSGRSTLVRRVAWSLGVRGAAASFIAADGAGSLGAALDYELAGREPQELVLCVDDADRCTPEELARLDALREQGAVLALVVGAGGPTTPLPGRTFGVFELPPLDAATAASLVGRMIPSLSPSIVAHIVARSGGWPGALRAIVTRLEGMPIVSVDDVDRRLAETGVGRGAGLPVGEVLRLLDRGRFDEAADALEAYRDDRSPRVAIARAMLATGRGDPRAALGELRSVASEVEASGDDELVASWHLQEARARLRSGEYAEAERHSLAVLGRLGAARLLTPSTDDATVPFPSLAPSAGAMVADALAVSGLAASLSGRHEDAAHTLSQSVAVARASGEARLLAVALGSLGYALQRNDRLVEAQTAYEEALALAETAGDAGSVATTRLNLAGIAHTRGDVAGALVHLEAAVDMGRRSGRESTVRQALLNLAQLDLFLGRQARARASIDALAAERRSLSPAAQAQLLALEADSAALADDLATASHKCLACASAYADLGRPVDAAEALLERVGFLVRAKTTPTAELAEQIHRAETWLADSGAHQGMLELARGHVARLCGETDQALAAFERALAAGGESGKQDWVWRAHEGRELIYRVLGDLARATEAHGAAVAVLDAIAAELPRDLREVFWDHPRRRAIRRAAATLIAPEAMTQLATQPREDRLARVLEINREIAGEYDLDRLLGLVTDHAVALLSAERGFVLLRSRSGEDRLSVHAVRARGSDDPHARFSQSIAQRVVETGESFVAVDAGGDERMADYVSVHQLMLKSVACVPIRARTRLVIGALYLETRLRAGTSFRDELPTLAALADQVAIAIETARLWGENQERARELEATNRELEAARQKLEQLLGRRTEQLELVRRDLRSARAVIRGHFGYKGIVGTSPAMRRVYDVIERVKDAEVPVLLTGESGTGKEIVARTIHAGSPRAKHRFVGINCGAIPEHLLESELFGHVRGAFTGADRDKKGLFREVDEGTILLDEIGEMPQKMQAGLLRVLQEKVVRPVGGTREEPVRTRVIAATHRNLAEMVAQGRFREDLYYRLNVIEIRVPPLRERLDDVPVLIDHFLRLFAARYARDRRTVSREALKRLTEYRWPGNVRQLENVLLNAWILSDEAELRPEDFQLPEAAPVGPGTGPVASASGEPVPANLTARDERERGEILRALSNSNWNRAKAAELIGMPRRTFYRRLTKYGIQ